MGTGTGTGTGTGMKNKATNFIVVSGLAVALASSSVSAQVEDQISRNFSISPRIKLTETWSDNVSISSGQSGKESGFISELTPGIRIDAKTARLKAYFDYALTEQNYSTSSGRNRSQNALNTFGTFEAVSNWLYLDFSGIIAQQAISAFAPQSPSGSSINSNSTETSTYRLSPYIRGRIAGNVDYSLRYNWSTTNSNASAVSSIDVSDWSGQLRGGTGLQNLNWSLDATQQTSSYSLGRTTDAERLYGTATYTIVPQLRVSMSGGRESNNYASQNMESRATHGFGFDWSPTERTEISAFKERRFFGNGHRYSISHRFPLSSIRYSDTRDVSVLPNQFTTIGLGTIFDMFYQICTQQLSSLYSDAVQLNQAANTCAANLVGQFGVPPNAQVTSSFLSSRATIQRSQQLALAFQGVQNTLTVIFNRNESQSIFAAGAVNDTFSQNNTTNILQHGFSINIAHNLSAITHVSLTTSRQKSTGNGNNRLEATTSMYQANLNSNLGARTTGGITIRHTKFENSTNPFTENAIIGTVSVIF